MDDIGLILRKLDPENLECPINGINSWITPNNQFFIRNHLSYPSIQLGTWELVLDGEVNTQKKFGYEELLKMSQLSKVVTLECAGNKRGLMEPKASGDQFGLGAIGNAKWSGVSLLELLDTAGIKENVKEIVFTGSDCGQRPDMPGDFNFIRSLPYDMKILNECLLALQMNDEPLPFKHGFPLRLIVPGWCGMAHVKWLTKITASAIQFKGPFQAVDYVYINNEDDYSNAAPVTENKVNSIITWPSEGELIKPGTYAIRGIAWAGGNREITNVQVSTDNGISWFDAQLTNSEYHPYTWYFWSFTWTVNLPGHYIILARARDTGNTVQPRHAVWNAKGYGNNSVHRVDITIPAPPIVI